MYRKLSRASIFSSNIYKLFAAVGCVLLLSFISRLVFLLCYANFSELKPFIGDTFFAFIQGARFDLLLACYLLVPNIVFSIFAAIFKKPFFEKIAKLWSCVGLILYSALLIIDFYYYSFFGSHFNILAFGIIDDDTGAVMKSMWTDFPVIRVFLFFIALSVLECFVIARIYKSKRILNLSKKTVAKGLLVILIPLYILAMRGSVKDTPLRQPDAYFSKSPFVNMLTVNGIFSLKTAYSDYKKNKFDTDINAMLAEAGFSSDKELASAFTGIPVDSIIDDPLSYFRQQTCSDSVLKENPPHVVVLQMEGMGLNMMNLHSEDFNILGKLADELAYCFTFKNFMPSYEGTIASLEGIITGTAIVPISGSAYAHKTILSSGATPFNQSGYTSTLATGGKIAWRNLNEFALVQGFSHLEGMETIMEDVAGAVEEKEWGVFDEYMFQHIWNKLNNASSPQLIYGMSITNHTPYNIPDGYVADGLNISEELKERLLKDESMALKCFSSYRYACDCLADFILKIRTSPLAENTIIAITGDHSIKGMVRVDGNNLLENHGVPLILYIPQKYLNDRVIDTTFWGSHKDIFPTLINLSLPDAYYYKLGVNIVSEEAADNIAIGEAGAMNQHGAVSSSQFYEWNNSSLVAVDEATPALAELRRKSSLWNAISKYIVLRSIAN